MNDELLQHDRQLDPPPEIPNSLECAGDTYRKQSPQPTDSINPRNATKRMREFGRTCGEEKVLDRQLRLAVEPETWMKDGHLPWALSVVN